MEIGLYTFAETTADPVTGRIISAAQRLRDLLEEIELADQVGLDVFGVGEHHRPEYVVSAPAVVLAAAAERSISSAARRAKPDTIRRDFPSASTRMPSSPTTRNGRGTSSIHRTPP